MPGNPSAAAGSQRRPRATYRLQFGAGFGFEDARGVVPYLAALGISHVYASPLLLARAGSTHGYDIVDHGRLNPEIGTAEAFDDLVDTLRRHGMGLILDFVPNHMGIGPDNPWWMDVLEWGPASPHAAYFDIDWAPPEASLAGKVLLPVLGDHYGAVLERGELRIGFARDHGRFALRYFEHPYPIAPKDYPELLLRASDRADGDGAGEAARALDELVGAFGAATQGGGSRALAERRQHVADLQARLADAAGREDGVTAAIEGALAEFNGEVGRSASFDALHRLLERQAYRLAHWRIAAHEINYRRFFDVNDLAGLRMEHPALFEASHRLVAKWLAGGKVDGLRLDHVDGLRDPKGYFERLQLLAATSPLYVVVEKILAPHEALRSDWQVSGTTGYEFMNAVNGLFVDPSAERSLTTSYRRLAGGTAEFEEQVVAAKYQIMRESLASELNVLANAFNRIAKQARISRDYSFLGLREALAGVVAHFPVYRTYVRDGETTSEDRRDIDWAVGRARREARTPDRSVFDFVHAVLTLDLLRAGGSHRRRDVVDAALKFQQYTGPVMAKATEDTTFYRYVRLVSTNEVGGEPARFGTSPAAFHETNRRRLRSHPDSLLATATHDHKRGEDVRARLNVLSEVPREWRRRVQRWLQLNRRKRSEVDGRPAPSRADEYLFYQTVVGAWPLELVAPEFDGLAVFRERIDAYMRKAVREAKLRTSWAAQDEPYEEALTNFVARTLDLRSSRPFIDDVHAFVEDIAAAGAVNGLAQTLLKLTSPGVPDVYQGTEGWDLSLVDPDNRRPVDYRSLRDDLAAVDASWGELLGAWRDGRVKQALIARTLALRRDDPELFAAGEYLALEPAGAEAHRVLAFARCRGRRRLLVIVPRLSRSLLRRPTQARSLHEGPLLADPSPDGSPSEGPTPERQLGEGAPLRLGPWGSTRLELPETWRDGGPFFDVLARRDVPTRSPGTLMLEDCLAESPVTLLVSG
jgi:(1->4)-alpha-D-glucan 1-alpha-D-glucosylmutase